MDDAEKNLFNLLGVCFNRFNELLVMHDADSREFLFHIHALQNIVLARGALRALVNAGDSSYKTGG